MKMRTFLLVFLLGLPIVAPCKDKPDPRLATVTTVFVKGNNQGAKKARATLGSGKTRLSLATKAEGADAVLEVAAESQSMGGGFGGFGGRTWVVSGTLTLESGDLVWSHSQRFSDDPLRSGGKISGELLVKHLAADADCKDRVKK